MIAIDPENLENVLAAEVGEDRAAELISLFEAAGAVRAEPETALVTIEQAAEWAGRALTDSDVGWLRREIPKTPIPDAISMMAVSLTVPEDADTGSTTDLSGHLRATGEQRDPTGTPTFPRSCKSCTTKPRTRKRQFSMTCPHAPVWSGSAVPATGETRIGSIRAP
jgi:hypothetical protein